MSFPAAKKPLLHRAGVKEFCPWCNGIINQKEKKKPKGKVMLEHGLTWMHLECYKASKRRKDERAEE